MKKILFAIMVIQFSYSQNTFPSSGNVGIGTLSPTTKLDIRGTSETVGSTLQIVGNSTSTLLLGQNADGGVIRGQGGNNVLSFWTGGLSDLAASGSGSEKARIISNGNVLIGTTTDTGYKLNVNGPIYTSSLTLGAYSNSPYTNSAWIHTVSGVGAFITNNTVTNWAGIMADGSFDVSGGQIRVQANTGNVGIGTTAPNSKLEIVGSSNAGYEIGSFKLQSGTVNQFMYFGYDDRYSAGYIQSVKPGTDQQNILLAPVGGNIGIGSTNPDSKLTVKGKIHAEEVKVDLAVPADYVFEKYYSGASSLKPDYILPTLSEVEKFTKENHHLPNLPSAKAIQENGVQLGEMSNILLQKIEELTLYVIEMKKENENLKKENDSIKIEQIELARRIKNIENK